MNMPSLPRLSLVVRRAMTTFVALVIVAIGFFWFVRPLMTGVSKANAEKMSLEQRMALLIASRQTAQRTDAQSVLNEFERLVPPQGRDAELMETIARLALEPTDASKASGLSIEASAKPDTVPSTSPGASQPSSPIDPRWALFPWSVDYTPITVTFETTYERLGIFLWRLRELPSVVEIQSLQITRGLPLLKVKVVLLALRHGPIVPVVQQVPTNRRGRSARPSRVIPSAPMSWDAEEALAWP